MNRYHRLSGKVLQMSSALHRRIRIFLPHTASSRPAGTRLSGSPHRTFRIDSDLKVVSLEVLLVRSLAVLVGMACRRALMALLPRVGFLQDRALISLVHSLHKCPSALLGNSLLHKTRASLRQDLKGLRQVVL